MRISTSCILALALLGGACATGSTPDLDGAGGSDSATTTTTMGSTGAGAAGAGGANGCMAASDCPGADDDCQQRICHAGQCSMTFTAAGIAVSAQVAHDCQVRRCDGSGAVDMAADDTDLPDDGDPCTEDSCAGGVPSHAPAAAGTKCGVDLVCDGGACVGCIKADDCPGQDTECKTRSCEAGTCGFTFAPAATAVAAQSSHDCKKNQCDGSGDVVSVADDTDVPVDGNTCTSDVCTSGTPSNPPAAGGTACTQNGGSFCNALGACVSCLSAATCPGQDTDCKARTCTAGTCGVSFVAAGAAASAQIAGDCKKSQCDGAGNVTSVLDAADVPNDGNACTNDLCNGSAPAHTFAAAGVSCAGGSATCDGAGHCDGCATVADCPGADTTCLTRTCISGACGVSFTAAGTMAGAQIAQDCHRNQCDGAGNIVAAVDDSDAPDDARECTVDMCTGGAPVHVNLPAGTVCTQGGGTLCNAAGICQTCTDGVQDGSETGVDCGGACPACPPTVVGTAPSDAATMVAVTSKIGITFSSSMNVATLTYQSVATSCSGSVQVSADGFVSCIGLGTPVLSGGNTVLTLTPKASLSPGSTYKIKVTAAGQSSGGMAVASYQSSAGFTTAATSCAGAIVISQIYGGGGNSGASFANDFVELHNRGGAAVSVAGWSLQYASATGTSWSAVALTGSIPPGGYYLVKLGSGGAVGGALPTADASAGNNISATAGKLALVSAAAALSGTCPTSSGIVDLVGYGSTASCSEGASPASGPSSGVNTVAMFRAGNGCTDANANATDFTTGAPSPHNSATMASICACAAP